MPETILVAMSGGVDSSTVAGMLIREGHRVIGMTMQLWNQRRLPEIATDKAPGAAARSTMSTTRVASPHNSASPTTSSISKSSSSVK